MTYLEKQKIKFIETLDKCISEEQGLVNSKLESLKITLQEGGKRDYAIKLCDSISHHYSVIRGLEIAKSNTINVINND